MARRGEHDVLDRLIEAVRAGESQALVVRGGPGVGKTALLEYLAGLVTLGDMQRVKPAIVSCFRGINRSDQRGAA